LFDPRRKLKAVLFGSEVKPLNFSVKNSPAPKSLTGSAKRETLALCLTANVRRFQSSIAVGAMRYPAD
jgi:hypothetical protein